MAEGGARERAMEQALFTDGVIRREGEHRRGLDQADLEGVRRTDLHTAKEKLSSGAAPSRELH